MAAVLILGMGRWLSILKQSKKKVFAFIKPHAYGKFCGEEKNLRFIKFGQRTIHVYACKCAYKFKKGYQCDVILIFG